MENQEKKNIKELTAKQWQFVNDSLEEWLGYGRSTKPADHEEVERALSELYRLHDQKLEKVTWYDGPTALLKAEGKDKLGSHGWIYPSPHWIAHHYTISQLVDDNDPNKKIVIYDEDSLAKLQCWVDIRKQSNGVMYLTETTAAISENNIILHVDERGLLHCETGPAWQFLDGTETYAWHGTEVPKEWIEDSPPIEAALRWENMEQRRCAAEILGWEKVLAELNPKVIDENTPDIGRLLEVDLPDSPKEKFLEVLCGTGRSFIISVPKEMKTAHQANAWTYGFEPDEWLPKVRT